MTVYQYAPGFNIFARPNIWHLKTALERKFGPNPGEPLFTLTYASFMDQLEAGATPLADVVKAADPRWGAHDNEDGFVLRLETDPAAKREDD